MATPRKGSARWVEAELHALADDLKRGEVDAATARALTDIYKGAYELRIARAGQIRANQDVETYIEQDERGPDLKLIEGQKG